MDVGEKVAERFHVEAFIGAGGMGAVYRARDEHTGAVVALKSLLHADGDNLRLARESRLLAELHHPGIVPYVAHGVTVGGERWLAMQWLEGEDLAERLARTGLNLTDALEVVRGAADALAAAHARGVVHRDVKPSNLFLEGGDPSRVRLLDFGIARDAGIARATMTGAVLGTPGYMAPEQARGEIDVGPAADVFSLGCVAFECLTATRPFVADHALAVILRIVLEDAPRPRDRRADIPEDLDALVFEMLSKRPEDRPRDAAEVARRLATIGDMPPSMRSRTLHLGPQPSLTEGEERLVSLVVAAALRRAPTAETIETAATLVTDGTLVSTGGSERPAPALPGNVRVHDDALAAWQRIAREHGARTDVLADGLLVATLGGQGSAADQAARAARCALAFRAAVPYVPMVLTTGRRDVRTRAVVGDAIDRAVELLRIETARRDSDFVPRVAPAPIVTTVLLDDVSAALLDVRFDVGGEPKELRGERDRADAGRLLLGKKSPSVGRDREIAHLEALFDECTTEPVACAVVVTAPAGIGKSRLRSELLARIGGRARSIWIGEGDAMRSGAPFAMIAPAVRRAAGIVHGEPLAMSREKLIKRVAEIVAPADAPRTACFLGELCGVPFPDETSVELRAARHDPLVMGDQTRRAWSVLLEAETRVGPLVIVLEDLHWGDLPSVKLCDEALRDLRQRPLFILALARPEVDDLFPQLWAKRGAHRIALGPLGRAASERLVSEALGSSVSADVVQRIAARAGGNAFYLEELIRTVARAGGKWQDDLPETVLAMVEAHLDRLHPDARRILRAASVYGQTFWRSSALALLGGAGDARRSQMSDRIRELIDEEVILPGHSGRFPAEEEYVFQHALVRDAAYGTLTDEDRGLGHRLAAAWLEQSGENDAMLLAEHHERAGDPERALSWLVRAASQAIEANDFDAAITRADRAIARGAKDSALGTLRILQAEVHIWRSDHVRAEAALAEAMAVVPRGGALWCKGAAGVLAVHAHSGNIGELARMVEELRTTDPTNDARSAYVMPAAFVVSYASALGMYPLAQAFLDRLVIVGAGPSGFASDPIAEGWMRLAKRQRARFVAGDPWAYYVLGEAAVESFERGGDARNALLARAWWGHATLKLGRPEEAERQMRALLEKTADVGLHYVDATARIVLALSLVARATAIDEACAEAERATDLLARTNKVLGGFARTALATVRLRAGDLLGAEREARQASDSLYAARPYRAHALAVLAESLLGQGRAADAREIATEALSIVESLGAFEDAESLVRLVDAEARQATGDAAGANEAASMAWRRILARTSTIPRGERRGFLEIREHTRTRQLLG